MNQNAQRTCLHRLGSSRARIWPVPTLAEFDAETERGQPTTKLR